MGRRGWSSWGEDYQRRDPDNPANQPSRTKALRRKDTRHWCRGKPGVEHQPHIVFRPHDDDPARGCQPRPDWARWSKQAWWCVHRQECAACGKVLNVDVADRCPDRKEDGGTPVGSGKQLKGQ